MLPIHHLEAVRVGEWRVKVLVDGCQVAVVSVDKQSLRVRCVWMVKMPSKKTLLTQSSDITSMSQFSLSITTDVLVVLGGFQEELVLFGSSLITKGCL